MKRLKKKMVWGMLLTYVILLNSCKDSMLAEDIVGSWTTSFVISYDDGTKGHRDEQLTFKRDNSSNNGGVFYEKIYFEDEIENEEGNIKYKYVSTIEGTWEINKENLHLHYNISKLEVRLNKKDIDFDRKYIKVDFWGTSSSVFEEGYEQDQFIKELKKSAYKKLFNYYKSLNEDTENNDYTYQNVHIQGDVLSFETPEMEKKEYNRESENVSSMDEEDNTKEDDDYQHQRCGVIGEYKIVMCYDIDKDNNVSGYYYYESQGPEKRISFTGKIIIIDSKEQLTLRCNNRDIFDGYFDENRAYYTGDFSNINNNKLEFVLYSLR